MRQQSPTSNRHPESQQCGRTNFFQRTGFIYCCRNIQQAAILGSSHQPGCSTVCRRRLGVCNGYVAPYATVDQNGVAQCSATYVGTATIVAGTRSGKVVNPDSGPQLAIFGSATLTCP